MVYGTVAVIPAEIAKAMIQTAGLLESLNDQMLRLAHNESNKL